MAKQEREMLLINAKKQKKIASHLKKGNEWLSSNKYDRAIKEFEQILKLDPHQIEISTLISDTEKRKNAYKEKQLRYKQAIKTHLQDGKNYLKKGNYDDAIVQFERVISIQPWHSEATDLIQETYTKKKESKKYQKDAAKHLKIGQDYLQSNNFSSAIEEVKKIYLFLPSHSDAKEFIRKAEIAEKRYLEQEKNKLNAAKAENSLVSGLNHLEKGRFRQAGADFQKAKNMGVKPASSEAGAYLKLVKSLKKVKDFMQEYNYSAAVEECNVARKQLSSGMTRAITVLNNHKNKARMAQQDMNLNDILKSDGEHSIVMPSKAGI